MAETTEQGTVETRGELKGSDRGVKFWLSELRNAAKAEEDWRRDADTTIEDYRDVKRTRSGRGRHNILFSNTQTLMPALFDKAPRPDVRRRFRDQDPVGKEVAEVIERALAFAVDDYDIENEIGTVLLDYLLAGRGVLRVRYVPTFDAKPSRVPVKQEEFGATRSDTGEPVDDFEKDDEGLFILGDPEEALAYEQVTCERVHWRDYRQSPAKSWADVWWVAFRTEMTRDQLTDRFGQKSRDVELTETREGGKNDESADIYKRAEVWEIWDWEKRQVHFLAPGNDGTMLESLDDPLKLKDFYPMPRPIYSIPAPDDLVPRPEYFVYYDQARELDEVTNRIRLLTKALKARGVYDASIPELAQVFREDDNALIPAENIGPILDRGGLDGAIWMIPIETIAEVLTRLYVQREQIKQEIFELTGIADIIRGSTKASETATAQRIKGNFATLRLDARRGEVARLLRDVYRLKAEIITEQFAPETLQIMTGKQVTPEMIEIMRDDALRSYRIDIETDSTIAVDEQAEQQAITELLTSVTGFLTAMAPLVAQGAVPIEVAKTMLQAAVRRFRLGREIEDALELIGQAPEQPQQGVPGQPQGAPQQQIGLEQ